jgi:hypothetical protein
MASRADFPMAEFPPAATPLTHTAGTPARPRRCCAQLPNGVTLEFACGDQDAALVSAVIEQTPPSWKSSSYPTSTRARKSLPPGVCMQIAEHTKNISLPPSTGELIEHLLKWQVAIQFPHTDEDISFARGPRVRMRKQAPDESSIISILDSTVFAQVIFQA